MNYQPLVQVDKEVGEWGGGMGFTLSLVENISGVL